MVSFAPEAPSGGLEAKAPVPMQPDGLNVKLESSALGLEYCQDSPEPSADQTLIQAIGSLIVYRMAPIWRAVRVILATSKTPIWWLLSGFFAWLALSTTTNLFLENVELEQLCELPILPKHFLHCAPRESFSPDFRKLVVLQSQLQGAMEKSTNTLAVAIDLKHSEIAVRDLTTLVKLSSLVSKDSLAKNLRGFVENARTTGRSLQKFGGHVGSAVDQTIAMNEYTIEVLESMAKDKRSWSLAKFFHPRPTTDLKATWFETTELMKLNVMQLVDEAMANMRALDRLDNELSVIHRMVARADNKVERDRAETLSSLWTTLGGNKEQLAQFNSHTRLLKGVTDYRKQAVEHVNGALFQLERLALGLNDLNEQVTAPLLADRAAGIPLEVHIKTIQKGTARLLEGRARERKREDEYMRRKLPSSRS
ncbi:hypothetical protein FS749_008119 [Ceratobasidium sp. UAMH 11750]|nr:hypothetical protein FS749_008119 [Ceratobasidium sp. UAMH 11750]